MALADTSFPAVQATELGLPPSGNTRVIRAGPGKRGGAGGRLDSICARLPTPWGLPGPFQGPPPSGPPREGVLADLDQAAGLRRGPGWGVRGAPALARGSPGLPGRPPPVIRSAVRGGGGWTGPWPVLPAVGGGAGDGGTRGAPSSSWADGSPSQHGRPAAAVTPHPRAFPGTCGLRSAATGRSWGTGVGAPDPPSGPRSSRVGGLGGPRPLVVNRAAGPQQADSWVVCPVVSRGPGPGSPHLQQVQAGGRGRRPACAGCYAGVPKRVPGGQGRGRLGR